MPRISADLIRIAMRKKHPSLTMIYTALVFLSLHWAVVIYINSSYLGVFANQTIISALYFIGSLFSLLFFFFAPHILQKIGNYKLTILCTFLEFIAVVGMGFSTNIYSASFFFILHFVQMPLLLFCLDVFIEALIGTKEKETGAKRGLYLSLLSLATAFGPLFTGHLLLKESVELSFVYFISTLFLLPFLYIIIRYFKQFRDTTYTRLSLKSMLKTFRKKKDVRSIVLISFHLQLFFTWMVIYAPLYLAHEVGFTLSEVGLIFFVGLMAYVLSEYPIGIIADKYIGEKEMMACGFVLLAITTSWYAFLLSAPIGFWMCAVFATRVGASLVEATSESYFFKHAQSNDTDAIALFRATRPLSSLIGAVLGGIALLYIEFNLLFILLAFLMIPGLFLTLTLKDTK